MTDNANDFDWTTHKKRPGMATRAAIQAAWGHYLIELGRFDDWDDYLNGEWCMACGITRGTDRAHISAAVEGGSHQVENLNLLCELCHKASEYIDGDDYFDWLEARSPVDVIIESFCRRVGGATALRDRVIDAVSLYDLDSLKRYARYQRDFKRTAAEEAA